MKDKNLTVFKIKIVIIACMYFGALLYIGSVIEYINCMASAERIEVPPDMNDNFITERQVEDGKSN